MPTAEKGQAGKRRMEGSSLAIRGLKGPFRKEKSVDSTSSGKKEETMKGASD